MNTLETKIVEIFNKYNWMCDVYMLWEIKEALMRLPKSVTREDIDNLQRYDHEYETDWCWMEECYSCWYKGIYWYKWYCEWCWKKNIMNAWWKADYSLLD